MATGEGNKARGRAVPISESAVIASDLVNPCRHGREPLPRKANAIHSAALHQTVTEDSGMACWQLTANRDGDMAGEAVDVVGLGTGGDDGR